MLAFRAPFAFGLALPVLEGLAYFNPLRSLSGARPSCAWDLACPLVRNLHSGMAVS